MRSLLTKSRLGYVLAGVFLLLSIYLFFRGRAPVGESRGPDLTSAVTPAESEGVVRFTSSLNLAQRMGADLNSPPLFRAGVTQAIDRDVEFKVPRAGKYLLAMQMTDTPFVIQKQAIGEYLDVVREDQAIGQTFTVGSDVPQFSGVQVMLEARSILSNQPADTPPDAPLTATLYSDRHDKLGEYVLPVEQAGLNDAWRWVSFHFDSEFSQGNRRKFFVEFSSPSTVTGWALSRVSNGFGGIADHYSDGELLINGKPPTVGPSADLAFAVLTRSSENKQPLLLVDETELTFSPLPGDQDWFASEPTDLSDGVHLLVVRSSNPHLSFFRFIFVPESDTSDQATLTPSPTPTDT